MHRPAGILDRHMAGASASLLTIVGFSSGRTRSGGLAGADASRRDIRRPAMTSHGAIIGWSSVLNKLKAGDAVPKPQVTFPHR